MLYLDANATEPLRPTARAAATAAMDATGNPSSIHTAGRNTRKILESARESLGTHFQTKPQNIIFTSGATEANALAIHALSPNRPTLTGATEHDSIRAATPNATTIPTHPNGTANLAALESLLLTHPNALVCLMAANNETGILHDIQTIAKICATRNAILHIDATQAAPRCNQNWLALGAASFAISGHKAGGPAGAGALICAPHIAETLTPIQKGGGQESNRRGGTPPLPAIAGMAAAFTETTNWPRIAAIRDEIAAAAKTLGAIIPGETSAKLPNTICLAYPNLRAETQLIALDSAGIAVSAGAACSSGKLAPSHVLAAMGLQNLANNAIRISLPWNTPPDTAQIFIAAYTAIINRITKPTLQPSPTFSTDAQTSPLEAHNA